MKWYELKIEHFLFFFPWMWYKWSLRCASNIFCILCAVVGYPVMHFPDTPFLILADSFCKTLQSLAFWFFYFYVVFASGFRLLSCYNIHLHFFFFLKILGVLFICRQTVKYIYNYTVSFSVFHPETLGDPNVLT